MVILYNLVNPLETCNIIFAVNITVNFLLIFCLFLVENCVKNTKTTCLKLNFCQQIRK